MTVVEGICSLISLYASSFLEILQNLIQNSCFRVEI
jgi:hypothetical protein